MFPIFLTPFPQCVGLIYLYFGLVCNAPIVLFREQQRMSPHPIPLGFLIILDWNHWATSLKPGIDDQSSGTTCFPQKVPSETGWLS